MDISSTSAIVTGAGSGLGAAVARVLAKNGAHVIVLDRQAEAAERMAKEIGGTPAAVDVADEDGVRGAVELAGEHGPLRVLVNCAGLSRVGRTVDRAGVPFDYSRFEFVIKVNLLGTFNCIRLAAAAMSKTEPLADGQRGAIVNTASLAAFDGQIGQAAYSASKGGVAAMTLPIARDLAPFGIRVNTIAPGLFDTPIYGTGEKADAMKAVLGQSVVFPTRLGNGAEFASMALEAITNNYLNGETIRIDGAARLPPR